MGRKKKNEVFKEITYHDRLDMLEAQMKQLPQEECPLSHTFTPGLYTRTILMKAGLCVISKIHKTEHQYLVSKGRALVQTDDNGGWLEIQAPFLGITKPGTRRKLYILEDCVWTTMHPTDKKTVEEVEEDIIEKRDNPFINNSQQNSLLCRQE